MQPKEIVTILEGVVHEDTQRHEEGFDLTAAGLYRTQEPGRIDFGGGELESPTIAPIEAELRDPEDDYGWWNLDPGTYLVEYNEWIDDPPERALLLQPRDALLAQGAHHPTLAVRELPKMPLTVGGEGARIKENARVSTLIPF